MRPGISPWVGDSPPGQMGSPRLGCDPGATRSAQAWLPRRELQRNAPSRRASQMTRGPARSPRPVAQRSPRAELATAFPRAAVRPKRAPRTPPHQRRHGASLVGIPQRRGIWKKEGRERERQREKEREKKREKKKERERGGGERKLKQPRNNKTAWGAPPSPHRVTASALTLESP
jgi:hypothetical protein